ncbi:MAG: hypothetical protein ACE5HS_07035 [bacterium]
MINGEDIVDFYLQNLKNLLSETKKSIVPKKRQQFELAVAMVLRECLIELSKEAYSCSNGGWPKIKKKWHERVTISENMERRLTLFSPKTEQNLRTTLWWMAEQGEEEDLELIKKLKINPPYSSKEIQRLLKIAEQQIIERLNRPVDMLSDEELLKLTELQLSKEQQAKLNELLQKNREGELDSKGQQQLDELMRIYEHSLLRKSQALREAVKRRIIKPLQP